MALKERRNRLARSRSSHQFGNEDDDDEPASPTTVSPAAYIASRCAFITHKIQTYKKKSPTKKHIIHYVRGSP